MRHYDPDFLNALNELETFEQPLTHSEMERLSAAVLGRLTPASDTIREQGGDAPRPRRIRRLAALSVAAAAACAFGVTAVAAGPALLRMISGKISFFSAAPESTAETAGPLAAPHGNYGGMQTQLEAYNAAIGQSAEHGGVTITLDNVAMDVSSLDAFFTVQGNEAIQSLLRRDGYEPDWQKVRQLFSMDTAALDGEEGALYCDQTDFYLDEAGQLKIWAHYLLNTMPEGEAVTVALQLQCNVDPDAESGNGSFAAFPFTVQLDGTSVRAGGRVAEPGRYDMGQTVTVDPDEYREQDYGHQIPDDAEPETLDRPLLLDYLAFGPLGGTLAAQVPQQDFWDQYVSAAAAISPDQLYITDDTGRELYTTCTAGLGVYQRRNVTAPSPDATAVILTPVVADGTSGGEQMRTVTMEEMQNGVRLETSNLGGYTVQNFTIEDHAITYELVPYGWPDATAAANMIANDEGIVTLAEDQSLLFNGENAGQTVTSYHKALGTTTVDGVTGIITVRHDYYAATRQELEQIPSFSYPYMGGNYVLDTAHAVTLPLTDVN